ncbi:MAG: hypothetical protein ACK58N_08925 [Synechocystis sp.]
MVMNISKQKAVSAFFLSIVWAAIFDGIENNPAIAGCNVFGCSQSSVAECNPFGCPQPPLGQECTPFGCPSSPQPSQNSSNSFGQPIIIISGNNGNSQPSNNQPSNFEVCFNGFINKGYSPSTALDKCKELK